jgi:hypothetical protein
MTEIFPGYGVGEGFGGQVFPAAPLVGEGTEGTEPTPEVETFGPDHFRFVGRMPTDRSFTEKIVSRSQDGYDELLGEAEGC